MPAKPRKGEKKSKFMSRCMSKFNEEGKPKKQSAAICISMWNKSLDAADQPNTLSDNEILEAIVNIAAEKDLYDKIDVIRYAWENKFAPMGEPSGYVEKIFDSHIIVRNDGKLYKYSYVKDDDKITFGEPTEVEVAYVAV